MGKFIKSYIESINHIGGELEDDNNIEILKDLLVDVKDYTNSFLYITKIKNKDPELEIFPFVYKVSIYFNPFSNKTETFSKIKELLNINRLKEYGFKIVKQKSDSLNVLELFLSYSKK